MRGVEKQQAGVVGDRVAERVEIRAEVGGVEGQGDAGGALEVLAEFSPFLAPKVVREEREKGNLEAAAKVRRNGWGAATIGISLIGIGACLYFFS
ncbi:hypothetical protein OH809_22745 [Streptomyces sp. NBC_00873]|uniref:hypothetical protein n=1 Tax=unclassified Streptomyces TaxID=2593676 RepID=UPI003869F28F|nr:hypothetical protein OH809_22745 [Streptomyces sp. NBC_00873]WTA44721.1 hypothetical protein OH821_20550 [Streptomyces sp. NBC_00842]